MAQLRQDYESFKNLDTEVLVVGPENTKAFQEYWTKETIQQYAFNIQWHYSLNISEETDDAKYISLKTLWNNQNIVAQNNLEDDIFKAGTDKPAQVFNVNTDISKG